VARRHLVPLSRAAFHQHALTDCRALPPLGRLSESQLAVWDILAPITIELQPDVILGFPDVVPWCEGSALRHHAAGRRQ
jgi:hypothetical protein